MSRITDLQDLLSHSRKRELEAIDLLRQLFYARNALGAKFCDELEEWKLDDLHPRIWQLLNNPDAPK